MMDYIIEQPDGSESPFYSIVRSDGQVVAMQVIDESWAKRIVAGLRLLDVSEVDHSIESYRDALKRWAEGKV